MSGNIPSSGNSGGRTPGGKPMALLCEEWEALLVDALDGRLGATESAAFEAHREVCLACAQLLEEAKRGSEWLRFLEAEPEVPAGLVGRILEKTSGRAETLPVLAPVGMPVPVESGGWAGGWTAGWLPMMEKHAAQSRWMMTAAMAFFSIAFTLNMTGIKLTGLHLADLKPTTLASSITRQFYVADAHVMRYYDNLRFVYELESRVREIRRDTQAEPASTPGSTQGNGNKGSSDKKPASQHNGGSAQAPSPQPAPEWRAEPVMAKFEEGTAPLYRSKQILMCEKTNSEHENVNHKRAEGSLA